MCVSFLAETLHDFCRLPAYVELCATQELGEPLALDMTHAGNGLLLPLIIRGIPEATVSPRRRRTASRAPGQRIG